MMLGDCARGVAWRRPQQQNRDADIESGGLCEVANAKPAACAVG